MSGLSLSHCQSLDSHKGKSIMYYHNLNFVMIIVFVSVSTDVSSRNIFFPHRRVKQSRIPLRIGRKPFLVKPFGLTRTSEFYPKVNDKRNIVSNPDISYEGFVPIKYETLEERRSVWEKEEKANMQMASGGFPAGFQLDEVNAAPPVFGRKVRKAEYKEDSRDFQLDCNHPTEIYNPYIDLSMVGIQNKDEELDNFWESWNWEPRRLWYVNDDLYVCLLLSCIKNIVSPLSRYCQLPCYFCPWYLVWPGPAEVGPGISSLTVKRWEVQHHTAVLSSVSSPSSASSSTAPCSAQVAQRWWTK